MIRRVALLLGAAACAFTQPPREPLITVQNAAAWGSGVPVGAAAPGSIIAIQMVRGGPIAFNPDVAKISVKLRSDASGAEIAAPVLGASLGTVLAFVPKEAPLGSATVTMTNDSQASLPAQIRIVPVAPGLFAYGEGGFGQALAQNIRLGFSPALNRLTDPALAGEYVTLWGTGLGAARHDEVSVEVGGVTVVPAYAGPAPGFAGLDQVNIVVPAGAPDGCYISVILKARGAISNEVTIAKSAAQGACQHPFGLTSADLRSLDENRSVRLGMVSIRSEVMPPAGPPTETTYTRNGLVSAEFVMRDAAAIGRLAQPLLTDEAYYGCRLQNQYTIAAFTTVDQFDAGEKLAATGPGGKSLEVPRTLPAVYVAFIPAPGAVADPKDLPAPFFTPGAWRVGGAGGASVASFEASLALPPPLRWTNRDGFSAIDRAADQPVTWEPDGYAADDVMTVTLSTAFQGGDFAATGVMCRAPASAGRLVIPSGLLRQIPGIPGIPGIPSATLYLRLAPKPWNRARFALPLVAGGTVPSLFEYLYTETRRLAIR